MIGYSLAKGAEQGARYLGASESDAKDIGQIVGMAATLAGDPGGLVYVGKQIAETHFGQAAGEAVDVTAKGHAIGEWFSRHSG